MSHPHSAPRSPSNFRLVFNNAYEKHTKTDFLAHPLAVQLQACHDPCSILAILHQQVQGIHGSDNALTKWPDLTVNVLFAFSATLGEGVGLVFSPAKVIFTGIGVLLLTAKDVQASRENLIDIFERMEQFFQRLEIYTKVSPTLEMIGIIEMIMVEVLSILAIATKQSSIKIFLKKLVGKTDIKDALRRLDKLTNEEAKMATAEALRAAHTIDDRLRGVDARVVGVDDRVAGVEDRVASVDERVAGVDGGRR
ncbi:hypothetical protein F5148DRAFT_1172777 [Russula earlei]|uniref:Uncharacterized protein n=1 Tax=Russula earlei TaxID=71964 RepID=A0ACC0UJ22_9AGAM|nr:hypothetical protein F5148DRAFT_1172777 [Russula earlei]